MLPSLTLTSTIPARLPTGGLSTVAVGSDVTEKSASMQKADEIIKKFENRVKEGSLAKFEQVIKELYTNGSNLQEQHELCRQIASLITEESEVSVQEAGGIYLGYKVSVVSKAGGEPEEIFNAAEIYRQTKEYSPPESLQTTQFGSGRSQSLHKRKLEGKASDVTSSVRSPESSSKRILFSEYVLSTQSKDASKIELPSDTIESTTSTVTSPATQTKSATTSGTKDVATTSSVVSSTSQTKPLTGIGTKDEVTTDPGISTPPLPKKTKQHEQLEHLFDYQFLNLGLERALSWENRSSQIASECLATKKQADDACIQIRNGFRYSLGKAIPEIDKLAQDISVFESRAVKGKYRIVVPTSILTEARKPGALVSLTETCKSAIVASESRFSSWDSLVVPSDLFARSIKALEKRRAFLTTLQSLNTLGQ